MERQARDLTSYDLLKSLALVGMIVDHFGLYLLPHDLWIQAVARIIGPAWFFLAGYARRTAMPWPLWAGIAILAVASLCAGQGVFPLSALATFAVIRLTIDPLAARLLRSWTTFWLGMIVLVLLVLPSAALFEYGTVAVLVGLIGYLARHGAVVQTSRRRNTTLIACWLVASVAGTAMQELALHFPLPVFLVMAIGQSLGLLLLSRFRPAALPALTARLPRPVVATLHFGGRRTLEIYVAHLLLFKVLGCVLHPEIFHAFAWKVFYHP